MLVALMGTHIYLTFKLGFIQRIIVSKGIRLTFKRSSGEGEISPFSSLMTALAATVGTGNIVGVSTAVAAGGPGAVFWMWITGVFGMATKYAESLLSVKYRHQLPDGSYQGGAMMVLEHRLGQRPLAIFFAVMTVIASFGIGNMVQSNSIASLAQTSFGVSPWITGIVLAILTGLVLLGGLKSIAKTCDFLVPGMAIFYVFSCIVLLSIGWQTLDDSIVLIIKSAFSGHAMIGGFAGAGVREAIRFGVSRGLFSNESGMGSAPLIASAAKTSSPHYQALISATGTFWDTVVICLLTGLVVVNSGQWINGLSGAELSAKAFEHFPILGPFMLTIALALFVYSTILGWFYYGERALTYLTNGKWGTLFKFIWVILLVVGSGLSLKSVWAFSDIANALMVIPNLLSIWWLRNEFKHDLN